MLKHKLLSASAAVAPVFIEDVFSTWLYTGTGAAQTITNGIDLAGEGGLVWVKPRISSDHWLWDSARGTQYSLATNNSVAQVNMSTNGSIFNANGFTDRMGWGSGTPVASWTFRKAERFFDVVTYTGNGSTQNISHGLKSIPGCIIVKRTNGTTGWYVYHRSLGADKEILLNQTTAAATDLSDWNNTAPTASVFTVGATSATNASGGTYVAYLFAHDPLGPSGDGSDGLIACGSYTGNGLAAGPTVSLGWEPQWLLIRNASAASDWLLFDAMRGLTVSGLNDSLLEANTADAEAVGSFLAPTATGFEITSAAGGVNGNGSQHIYIAIRRGPMREPTVGTGVFNTVISSGATAGTSASVGFPVDLTVFDYRTAYNTNYMGIFQDRLRGYATANTSGTYPALSSTNTQAETALSPGNPVIYGVNNAQSSIFYGTNASTGSSVVWNFRRAPGFFDVVAYTGTGSNRTVTHNLGAVPELMIVKKRSAADDWAVYYGDNTDYLLLNSAAATVDDITYWNDTSPTSSVFTVGTNTDVNTNTATYIAYLFATLPGISKIGTYTGNGSTQTIDCGFTAGARFVMIKQVNAVNGWHVWDTARGIVAGNDPYLQLNSTTAEVTSTDHIDPANSGFTLATSYSGTNTNGGTYLYLAIA